jgi:apolipoprotein N-acyltransferase
MHRARYEAAALAAGVAWPFAFAPFGVWPLVVVSLGVLFMSLDGCVPRRAALRGFLFGLGSYGAGVWWVFISMYGFGALHWSLAGTITVLLVLVLAGFTAGFAWVSVRFLPETGAARLLAGLPAVWVLVEWFRGWFLSGFPWLSAGYAFTDAPLGGWSPVGGIYSVSLAAAFTAAVFVYLLRVRPRWPQSVGVLLAGTAVWAGAALLERVEFHHPSGPPVTVALVQGNVAQDLKWSPTQLAPTVRLYESLSADHWDADLVVWPEAALPALMHQLDVELERFAGMADSNGSALVMGMLLRDGDQYFNGIVVLGDGEGRYLKRQLVPFGEFFPVPAFVREWLRMMNLPYSDFTRGPRGQAPMTAAGWTIAGSICYEAAYASEMARGVADADLLANVSNDAWFGDTIAPHQHLQIVRQRAREAGRWMLRATNTGVTAVIDPSGTVRGQLPQFETGVLRAEVVPLTGATPYARYRNYPVLCLLVLMLGLALRFRYP